MSLRFLATITSFFCISFGYSTLIVGTTGDYAPFSSYNKQTKRFEGKDIDLIKEFAKASDEHIAFIKTTWKTASNDLKNHKFDVFVGGMTITPERKKDFIFSAQQSSFHKAAMTQCKSLSKYKSFEDIDNPQILVIENRGGTNESIALEKLKNAKLLITNDNQQAIKSLTNGIDNIHPDIMFTDTAEIAYQHSINPKLCEIPVNFDKNISYKAFMFNNGKSGNELKDAFNAWYKTKLTLSDQYQNTF